jgi:twitching motility protein PilU
MIGHRNQHSFGHIITIEDPVEFVHPHRNCLITQREVGVDTESWDAALLNTLRQAPDVILIGEIRQRETMEHAINFAETGHLCLSTLHANSANQALDRIINLFPEERRVQLLMDLSLNLKAVISQRLLPCTDGGRVAAIEILINSPLIQDLIFKGDVHGIKGVMKKSRELGMLTFDMALFDLYEAGKISYEDAMRSADSMNELRLTIKLEGHQTRDKDHFADMEGLAMVGEHDEDIPVTPLFGAPRTPPPANPPSTVPFAADDTTTGLAGEPAREASIYQPGVVKERAN